MVQTTLQSPPEPTETKGILPRYQDVFQACHDAVVDEIAGLFKTMFGQMDNFMMGMAETAETNAIRNHCFEVMHEILLKQPEIERGFSSELSRGFANFVQGKVEALKSSQETLQPDRLSLVDKEDYEKSLVFDTMLHNANTLYSSQLFALNHRLAALTGGVKLGEYHPALPGSPAQVCDALQLALALLNTPISHKIRVSLIHEFDRQVMRNTGPVYDKFNDILIKAGVLPNLSLEAIGYKAPTPQGGAPSAAVAETPPPPPEDEKVARKSAHQAPYAEDESPMDREIFNSIQEILARRHAGGSPGGANYASASAQTDIPNLLASLNNLQLNSAPFPDRRRMAQLPLESIKESFSEQLAKLTEIVKQQQVNPADIDIIDLVGMLFEFILNDNGLPDSVKALLSHLHTPILKVALLDKKFFFSAKHPARRLLNAMTQAGALCNAEDSEEHGIFARMQNVVDQILQNFEEDTHLFVLLFEDFNEFLEQFSKRSKVLEKRTIETAKGRERLREARQIVSQEIVDRTWNISLPKAVENLLMGPWANLMVLTLLRSGQDSEAWQKAVQLVDDVIWSVSPKETEMERAKVREKLPSIQSAVRNGLAMIGDPEVNTNILLDELAQFHNELLRGLSVPPPPPKPAPPSPAPVAATVPTSPPEQPAREGFKAIWDDVEIGAPDEREHVFLREADPVLFAIVDELKAIKLGATFEFTDEKKKSKFRAKLSWYSPKTSYYIFVNQAGIQVAVKSLRTLANEMRKGETKIVPVARKPFMDRALGAIHSILRPGENTPSASNGPVMN